MNIEKAIEYLEAYTDDLLGVGDYLTADTMSKIIKLLDDIKNNGYQPKEK